MNKQPFYHEASILFTATREVDQDELVKILIKALRKLPESKRCTIMPDTVECQDVVAEPGDPADLM